MAYTKLTILTLQPVLFFSLFLSLIFLLVTDESLGYISKGCPDIVLVNFYRSDHLTDSGVINLAKSCPRIRTLYISSRLLVIFLVFFSCVYKIDR